MDGSTTTTTTSSSSRHTRANARATHRESDESIRTGTVRERTNDDDDPRARAD
jgi:hypothetical protein